MGQGFSIGPSTTVYGVLRTTAHFLVTLLVQVKVTAPCSVFRGPFIGLFGYKLHFEAMALTVHCSGGWQGKAGQAGDAWLLLRSSLIWLMIARGGWAGKPCL